MMEGVGDKNEPSVVDDETFSGGSPTADAPQLAIKEEEGFDHTHFHSRASFFFILSYLCLVVLCVQRKHSTLLSLVCLVFQDLLSLIWPSFISAISFFQVYLVMTYFYWYT
ncbi:hypothetical protein GOODEAATRI_025138 [Goodea atripinnis]|uniref:Uncharacterized protein n=1 Tax=Goodea atripinnis TaxID=208336 RepID=A0ABV0Q0W2_9TELE